MSKFLTIALALLTGFTAHAQITFQDTYGDFNYDDAQAVIMTFEGGYCLVGSTGPNTFDSTDIAVFRLNQNGDIIWSTRIAGTHDDYISDVKQTSDGGFILTGTTYSSPTDSVYSDIIVLRIDGLGYVTWSKVFGGSDIDEAQAIVDAGNDHYVILGNTWSYGSVMKSALAIQIDGAGNQLWANVNSMTLANYFYKGAPTGDGGIIAAGGTYNISGGTNFDNYVTRFDDVGNILWCKRYGTTGSDFAYDIAPVSDGGYVVAGVSSVNTIGNADQTVFRIDSTGTLIWAYNYGNMNYDRTSSIRETTAGNFVVAGYTNVNDSVTVINQMLLEKIDANGNLLWANTYGDFSASSECYSMAVATDGYALAGFTLAFSAGIGDAYLVKTDTAGNSGCFQSPASVIRSSTVFTDSSGATQQLGTIGESSLVLNSLSYFSQFGQNCFYDGTADLSPSLSFEIFPNPANNLLTLDFGVTTVHGEIFVRDITGRILVSEKVSGINRAGINTSTLSPGIYLVSLNENGSTATKTFVKN